MRNYKSLGKPASTGNRMAFHARRPNIHHNKRILERIMPRSCWHLDVYLFRGIHGELYFWIETHAGAHELLTRDCFKVDFDILAQPSLSKVSPESATNQKLLVREVTLNELLGFQRLGINRIHRWFILPLTLKYRELGFKRKSVACHYIKLLPDTPMPDEGLPNLYYMTGRAARDLALKHPRDVPARHKRRSPLGTRRGELI